MMIVREQLKSGWDPRTILSAILLARPIAQRPGMIALESFTLLRSTP